MIKIMKGSGRSERTRSMIPLISRRSTDVGHMQLSFRFIKGGADEGRMNHFRRQPAMVSGIFYVGESKQIITYLKIYNQGRIEAIVKWKV
jgi:hypothetical protein